MQKETCESCRYWNYEQVNKREGELRQCRRRPPVFRGGRSEFWHAAFPETLPDAWCGSWQQRQKIMTIKRKRSPVNAKKRTGKAS